jgi:hypothetical protein
MDEKGIVSQAIFAPVIFLSSNNLTSQVQRVNAAWGGNGRGNQVAQALNKERGINFHNNLLKS